MLDGFDDKVYVYTASGQPEPSASFDLHEDQRFTYGITFAHNRFYVLDSHIDDRVYAYTVSGRPEPSAGFDLHSDNRGPTGITFANNRLYVVDRIGRRVYAYTVSGQPEPSAGFDLNEDQRSPAGITFADNRFYVVDQFTDKVHAVGLDAPNLIVQSPSVSDVVEGRFEFSATVRNRGLGSSAATTVRFYRSDDSIISTSDTQVGTTEITSLPREGTSSNTLTLDAPIDKTYYFGACVDSVSGEHSTGDNCSVPVAVDGGPVPAYDLDITGTTLDAPGIAVLGFTNIRMSVEVTNHGPNASRPARLRFSGGDRSFELEIPLLHPNQTKEYSNRRVGESRNGITVFRVCIRDARGETNTDNNCASRSVTYVGPVRIKID